MNNIFAIATIIFIFGMIAIPRLLRKIKAKQNTYVYSNAPSPELMSIPDSPVSFGYKCMWFAVPAENTTRLIEILNLRKVQGCNWQTGIEKAYENYVFITPAIHSWTLICGWGLPHGDTKEGIVIVKELLKELSFEYSEAQFFCTHRVTEYHCWMKAIAGDLQRVFAYLGESDEVIEDEGITTDLEKLSMPDNVPDEQMVMAIAAAWSIDPTTLEQRNDVTPGLGWLGER